MKKIKVIGFVRDTPNGGLSPVNYYRAYLPLRALQELDKRFEVTIFSQAQVGELIRQYGSRSEEILMGRDLYVISRLFTRQYLDRFVDAIHEDGGKVIFDTDDDLTDDYRDLGRGEDFKITIGAMDLVTVSTPFLSKRIHRYVNHKPPILMNHIDFKWFSKESRKAPRTVPGLTVGLVGTASHYDDWIYPVRALRKLAEESTDINLVVAGFFPDYLDDLPNLHQIKPVPYLKYPGMIRQFDIICCSLDPDDMFNKSKSAIKAIEAMSSVRRLSDGRWGGAVPVCTNMPVYRRAVNHMHNGILTSNDGWYDALSEMIHNTKLRNNIAVNGTKWVQKNRDINVGYKSWAKLYKRVSRG